jgi:hypothetical protein
MIKQQSLRFNVTCHCRFGICVRRMFQAEPGHLGIMAVNSRYRHSGCKFDATIFVGDLVERLTRPLKVTCLN